MAHIITAFVWSFVMILTSVTAGFVRYNVFSGSSDMLAYLNAVSTGVILAAAFTHLLPDAINNLEMYTYPVACASSLCGFLLLVIVETLLTYNTLEIEHKAAEHSHSRHDCSIHNDEKGSSPVHSFLSNGVPSSAFPKLQPRRAASENTACYRRVRRNRSAGDLSSPSSQPFKSYGAVELLTPVESQTSDTTTILDYAIHSHSHSHSHAHGHNHIHAQSHGGKTGDAPATHAAVYTFWLALVIHSTMEGFGIGVADTFIEQSTLVVAILIHKVFESIALAGLLIDSHLPYISSFLMFGTFVLATPSGAVISAVVESYVVSDDGITSKVVSGIITGLASGSFMYIGTMEMLPHMLSTCRSMLVGMTLFVLSAAIMAALAAVV
mmetsp:Transcript_14367/g.21535  ORF Transcript_14367/g.21535 Transcript_14367/m.21535 type:complete len:381 (+) Transcript_14367:71-1213(+)